MPSSEINIKELSADIRRAIEDLKTQPEVANAGIVTRVGDGIAWIYGLRECTFNEIIEIESTTGQKVQAFALNLGVNEIGAVLLGSDIQIVAGAKVTLTGSSLRVPVGPELIGRVVDPLGQPLDGKGPIKAKSSSPVENAAPGVLDRKSVHEPLMTGIVAIDTMVPIGRGQRELIVGDRQTGKTAVAIDTMINQYRQKSGIVNIYVAIGQKASKVARLVDRLTKEGVMEQSIVVSTSAADPAALLFLAPYSATAMGEYFRDNGQHGLIIYDDLTKHANAYRQMSLLLRRPPGREAFPGDVFYLHSRLLERSAKLSDKKGGGSLTALPIIETQAGDISAYVPTNVVSITDGQIFLETNLFYQGIRPAIAVGTSVSRVGGSAQTKAVKSVAGNLRLNLAQFRELAAFAQFSTDLDADTKQRIDRGQRLTELLKQPQYSPLSIWEQTSLLMAATEGAFDKVPVGKVRKAAEALFASLARHNKGLTSTLNEGAKPDDKTKQIILQTAKDIAKDYEEDA